MDFGLYEKLLDSEVRNQISEFHNETRKVDKSESAKVLATSYYKILRKILSEKKEEEKIDFVRKLNKEIGNEVLFEDDKNFLELLALHEDKDILKKLIADRPKTSISSSTLFTGFTGPTLESELRREIRTADRIDFIVSFIKYSGLVLILDDLVEFTKNKKLRIITTSYMGASDYKAILKLSQLPNTEVKISYDTNRTRLHAKAYYFERNTGFSTAYIGSSNISNPALSKGLEWNLKVSEYTSKDVVDSIIKTFESYWNDDEFRTFMPGEDEDKKELKIALSKRGKDDVKDYVFFDLRPFSHQKEILEDLRLEREEYRSYKNLVVAATGAGKTYISNALGVAACKNYLKVHYIRLPDLLAELAIAHGEGTFAKLIKAYKKIDLLILDEFLLTPLTSSQARELLEIIEARSIKGSTIFCTQFEPLGWPSRIGDEKDETICEAIMDRIIHNSYEILVEGRVSMRERHGIGSNKVGEDNE